MRMEVFSKSGSSVVSTILTLTKLTGAASNFTLLLHKNLVSVNLFDYDKT